MLLEIQGGTTELVRVAVADNKFSLGDLGPSISKPTFWVVLVMGLVTHLQNFGVDQGYIQRYVTAKSDGDAGRSVWLGGLCFIPLSAAFFFIGTGLYVLYGQRPGELPANIKSDAVLPHFIGSELPPGVMGLVLAAVFSAAMDSNLNCCATLYLCDIHRRYLRPGASERESMLALHISTIVMGALSIVTALALTQINSAALDMWWKLVGILSGGVLGLFLLGVLSRRATSTHAAIGVSVGATVIAWMTFSPVWKTSLEANNLGWLVSPFHDNLILVVGTMTVLLVGLAVSRFSVPQTREVRISSRGKIETLQEPAT